MAGRIPAWAHAPKGILPCREICPFAQQLPRGQIRKRAPRYDNSPHAAEDTYLPISRNSFVSPPSTAPIACSDPPPGSEAPCAKIPSAVFPKSPELLPRRRYDTFPPVARRRRVCADLSTNWRNSKNTIRIQNPRLLLRGQSLQR